MTSIQHLIDRRRALAAQLAGIELEIAMALGDREAAQRHQHEMNAQNEARLAARQALAEAEA